MVSSTSMAGAVATLLLLCNNGNAVAASSSSSSSSSLSSSKSNLRASQQQQQQEQQQQSQLQLQQQHEQHQQSFVARETNMENDADEFNDLNKFSDIHDNLEVRDSHDSTHLSHQQSNLSEYRRLVSRQRQLESRGLQLSSSEVLSLQHLKCYTLLSTSSDQHNNINRNRYYIFVDGMSNGYFSGNDMNEYSDLPIGVKYSFVTLSCACHQMGGRENCCTDNRAKINVDGVDYYLQQEINSRGGNAGTEYEAPSDLQTRFINDVCRTTMKSIGDKTMKPTGEFPLLMPTGSPSTSFVPTTTSAPSTVPTVSGIPTVTSAPSESYAPSGVPTITPRPTVSRSPAYTPPIPVRPPSYPSYPSYPTYPSYPVSYPSSPSYPTASPSSPSQLTPNSQAFPTSSPNVDVDGVITQPGGGGPSSGSGGSPGAADSGSTRSSTLSGGAWAGIAIGAAALTTIFLYLILNKSKRDDDSSSDESLDENGVHSDLDGPNDGFHKDGSRGGMSIHTAGAMVPYDGKNGGPPAVPDSPESFSQDDTTADVTADVTASIDGRDGHHSHDGHGGNIPTDGSISNSTLESSSALGDNQLASYNGGGNSNPYGSHIDSSSNNNNNNDPYGSALGRPDEESQLSSEAGSMFFSDDDNSTLMSSATPSVTSPTNQQGGGIDLAQDPFASQTSSSARQVSHGSLVSPVNQGSSQKPLSPTVLGLQAVGSDEDDGVEIYSSAVSRSSGNSPTSLAAMGMAGRAVSGGMQYLQVTDDDSSNESQSVTSSFLLANATAKPSNDSNGSYNNYNNDQGTLDQAIQSRNWEAVAASAARAVDASQSGPQEC